MENETEKLEKRKQNLVSTLHTNSICCYPLTLI